MQIVRDQCWLNETLKACTWVPEGREQEEIDETDVNTETDLQALLNGRPDCKICWYLELTRRITFRDFQDKTSNCQLFLTLPNPVHTFPFVAFAFDPFVA